MLGLVGYVFHVPILSAASRWWVVNSRIDKADAVVVLGGGLPQRPIEAARLYKAGMASIVVYTDVKTSMAAREELVKPETVLTRQLLLKEGVPESALVCVGHSVSNTYEECVAVRDWLKQSDARSLVIPTDEFHSRRVRWLFHKMLKFDGVRIEVEPVVNPDFASTNWWQNEAGVINFQNEIIKYGYYRLKY